MANSILTKIGDLTVPGSTGNQAITGVGFQPDLVFFFATPHTAFNSFQDGSGLDAMGIAASSTVRQSWYGLGFGSSRQTGWRTDACILAHNGTNAQQADLVSMDSDGFTINWSTVAYTGNKIIYVALGGTGIANTAMGTFNTITTDNTPQAVTGVGFRPNYVMFFGIGASSGDTFPMSSTGRAVFEIGGADKSFSSREKQYYVGRGTTGAGETAFTTNSGAQYIGNSIENFWSVTSFDSDGFTMLMQTGLPLSGKSGYLALKLNDPCYFVNHYATQPAATGRVNYNPSYAPGPSAGIVLSSNRVASETFDITTDAKTSFGFIGPKVDETRSTWNQAGTTSNKDSRANDVESIFLATQDTTTDATAVIRESSGLGMGLDWTVTSATARDLLFIMWGPTYGGAHDIVLRDSGAKHNIAMATVAASPKLEIFQLNQAVKRSAYF